MKTLLALLYVVAFLASAASYDQQSQSESDEIQDDSDESAEIYPGQETNQNYNYDNADDLSSCSGTGKIKSDNPCSLCFCKNGKKTCTRISCNQAVPRNCKEVREEGKCCPVIKCPEISPPVQKPGYERDGGDAECRGSGPIFSDNPCSVCFCRNGKKSCTRQTCNQKVPRGCKEVKIPGKCCPEINCPEISPPGQPPQVDPYNTGNPTISPPGQKPDYGTEDGDAECRGSGPIFSDNPCSICFCRNGKKSCTRQSCDQRVPRGCKEVKVPGKCCPEINCPEISPPDETPRDDPYNHGRCFGNGEIPNTNPCNKCSCMNGFKVCPAWNCLSRSRFPHCKLVKKPDQCCPVEECGEITVTRKPPSECTGDGPLPSPNSCTSCRCNKGSKSCVSVRCRQEFAPPNCEVKRLPGMCCPTVVCNQDQKPVDIGSITGCDKDGPKPSSDPCNKCYCKSGNLRCTKIKCPPVEPGCVAKRNPGQCCPKIECGGDNKY